MAGKPQAEKAVERFPELGCFAVAVRRIVYEKGMTLDNAIKKSGISKSAWFAGMAGSGGKPTRLPSLASFFAIADGLGITPEELIAAMRKEAGVREKSNGRGLRTMSRVFITMGSAYSKATNVNPVDGIWCSDCGWAGRVEEDMTDSEESEEPLFEEFSEYVPKFCPNCGVNLREP